MIGFSTGDLQLTPQRGRIGNQEYLILTHLRRGSTLWIDPDNDFSVVRSIGKYGDGTMATQLDIRYENDAPHRWIPTSWTAWCFGDSSLPDEFQWDKQLESRMESYTLNPSLTAKDFDVEFPVGTVVTDERDRERSWVVEPSGRRRDLSAFDLAARRAKMAEVVPSPFPVRETPPPARTRIWKVCLGLLVPLVILLLWRRSRRNQK